MENENKETQINLIEVFKCFLKKWWIIALSSVVCAFLVFVYLYKFTPQKYTSSVSFYVNNTQTTSIGGAEISLSGSDISASRSLVDTYSVILTSDTTLKKIFNYAYQHGGIVDPKDPSWCKYATEYNLEYDEDKAQYVGTFSYDYDELRSIVSVSSINDTEIFSVTYTCENAEDAQTLCDATLAVFPEIVKTVILKSETKAVDNDTDTIKTVGKGYTKYCLIAFLVGFVVSCGIIFVYDFFINDTISSSDYISSTFSSIPLLAVIPDTNEQRRSKYGKYYGKYYYKHSYDYYKNYYENDSEEEK